MDVELEKFVEAIGVAITDAKKHQLSDIVKKVKGTLETMDARVNEELYEVLETNTSIMRDETRRIMKKVNKMVNDTVAITDEKLMDKAVNDLAKNIKTTIEEKVIKLIRELKPVSNHDMLNILEARIQEHSTTIKQLKEQVKDNFQKQDNANSDLKSSMVKMVRDYDMQTEIYMSNVLDLRINEQSKMIGEIKSTMEIVVEEIKEIKETMNASRRKSIIEKQLGPSSSGSVGFMLEPINLKRKRV